MTVSALELIVLIYLLQYFCTGARCEYKLFVADLIYSSSRIREVHLLFPIPHSRFPIPHSQKPRTLYLI
ncbi:MAG: hypothetical protein F6K31_42570 [Symploca sp. SIO2G7]|nr:hypothetical protein [Symploca sp. SIO2G7]